MANSADLDQSAPLGVILSGCTLFGPVFGGELGGLVVNASDSGSRGRGFEPHSGQTVLCP